MIANYGTLQALASQPELGTNSIISKAQRSFQEVKTQRKQARRQKILHGGRPIRIEPVLTTKNERIFEIW